MLDAPPRIVSLTNNIRESVLLDTLSDNDSAFVKTNLFLFHKIAKVNIITTSIAKIKVQHY